MRRVSLGIGILMVLGTAPAMFADITDYMLNVNGTTYCMNGGATGCLNVGTSLSGSTTGFGLAGAASSIDEALGGTGLGTVSLLFTPGGAGSFNVNLWIFEQLSGSNGGLGLNEFGTSGGGPLAGGQSWQIDIPDYQFFAGDPNTGATGTIIANTAASTLPNTNGVPGGIQDCFLTGDSGPTCNDLTSLALGFGFTLGAGQGELLTFTVSTVAPSSGFYLEQIHPANDPLNGGNSAEIDYFFTGSATTCTIGVDCGSGPPPPGIPEPGSLTLLGTALGLVGWTLRSRFAAGKVG